MRPWVHAGWVGAWPCCLRGPEQGGKLRSLKLDRNLLESLEGLGRCAGLHHLSADGNRLRALGPGGDGGAGGAGGGGGAWLAGCGALRSLSLADNELGPRLPRAWLAGPRASLVELVLSRNALGDASLQVPSSTPPHGRQRCLRHACHCETPLRAPQ